MSCGKQEDGGYLPLTVGITHTMARLPPRSDDARLVHNSRILETQFNSSEVSRHNKEKGYKRTSHAKTLAEMDCYDFLKNLRGFRWKRVSDSTLPLIEKQGFIGFEGSYDGWNSECTSGDIEMGLFFEVQLAFVALGRSREIGSGLQSQSPWVFLLIPTIKKGLCAFNWASARFASVFSPRFCSGFEVEPLRNN